VDAYARSGRDEYLATSRFHILAFMANDATKFAANQARIVGSQAPVHLAIRRFDEAVRVDLSIGGQVADQANVWTFWRFNRTNATIVRFMHVTYFEACAVARQSTVAERTQSAPMPNFGQGVGLVHELRALAAAKEFVHG